MHDSSFQLIVEGADESQWCIHGPGAHPDVRLLEGPLGDFYDAPMSTAYKSRVRQPGSTFLASRDLERHIVLRVAFYGRDWAMWESRFRRAFDPERPATLRVISPLSGERRLQVCEEEHPQMEDGLDPHGQAIVVKKFILIAPNPYWREPVDYVDTFRFDGSNWSSGFVTVTNPTDTIAWPKWTVTAPIKVGLPDVPIGQEHDQDRLVWLPFQAHGSTALVDTDPTKEQVVSNGEPIWELMMGQRFMNPIPPATQETKLPVMVDPFPLVPVILDYRVRIWIAQRLEEFAHLVGLDRILAITPEELAQKLTAWMTEKRPEWVPEITAQTIQALTAKVVAEAIRQTYGRVANIAGAEAQVRLERNWRHPWG